MKRRYKVRAGCPLFSVPIIVKYRPEPDSSSAIEPLPLCPMNARIAIGHSKLSKVSLHMAMQRVIMSLTSRRSIAVNVKENSVTNMH